jgi:hypothetical protein
MPSAIAQSYPTQISAFHGPEDTIKLMVDMTVGPRGEQSTLVRSLKDHIVRDIAPKDYFSEMLAVRNFVAEKVKYSNDASAVEQVQDPERMAEEIVQHGKAVADCDEIALLIGTLCRQLGRDVVYVTVGFGKPGSFAHVFAMSLEPKSNRWIILDPVAGTDEASMLKKVTTYKIWRIAG